MTAASGWDGAAISEAARRVQQPSAACSLAAWGDDDVFMGAVLKRSGAAQSATHGWRGSGSTASGDGGVSASAQGTAWHVRGRGLP